MMSNLPVVTAMFLYFLLVNVTQFVPYHSYDRPQTFSKAKVVHQFFYYIHESNFTDIGANTSIRYACCINKTSTFNINIYIH